ncbi:hydrolase [Desulfurococcaceae archaeon MEX13E-LK6-19]|nr:hydrolase [Desulfurococcaceae archaeon MEX13E-LK6-19]
MPFTLFHIGPGLFFGLLLRKHIHPPTFLIANLIIDLEPIIMVFILGLDYPLHGYAHTFLAAIIIGILLGYTMYILEKYLKPIYSVFLDNIDYAVALKGYILAGILGAVLHVLFDSPLYPDIKPFIPLQYNFLYNPSLTDEIYMICMATGLIGIIYYLFIVMKYKKKP